MNERQLIRQARLRINYEIEQLNDRRCEGDCQETFKNCDCPVGTKLRLLGTVLDGGKSSILAYYQKGEIVVKKPKEHKKLTLDEYHAMKTQGKTDKDVRNHLGWSGTKLHEWKKKHGLVKPHKEDKPKVKPKKDSVPDDYQKLKEQFDLMSEKYQSLNDMYHGAESAVEILTEELQEVKTKLGYALQWEDRYNQLKEQIEKSLEWEKEYRKLEIDYRNEVTETKRLKDMLSNLKHTEVMNVMLMEQRVLLQRQLDEVTI